MQNREEKSTEFKVNPRRTWDLKELGCTKVAAALDNQRITFYEGTTLKIYDLDAKAVIAEREFKYKNTIDHKISGNPINFLDNCGYGILGPITLATVHIIPVALASAVLNKNILLCYDGYSDLFAYDLTAKKCIDKASLDRMSQNRELSKNKKSEFISNDLFAAVYDDYSSSHRASVDIWKWKNNQFSFIRTIRFPKNYYITSIAKVPHHPNCLVTIQNIPHSCMNGITLWNWEENQILNQGQFPDVYWYSCLPDGQTLIGYSGTDTDIYIMDIKSFKQGSYKIGQTRELFILPNGNVISFDEKTGIATEYEFEHIAELRDKILFKNIQEISDMPSDHVRLVAGYVGIDCDLSPPEDPIPQPKIEVAVLADNIKKVTGLTLDFATLIAEYDERALLTISNNSSSLFSVKSNTGSGSNKSQSEENNQSPKPI